MITVFQSAIAQDPMRAKDATFPSLRTIVSKVNAQSMLRDNLNAGKINIHLIMDYS